MKTKLICLALACLVGLPLVKANFSLNSSNDTGEIPFEMVKNAIIINVEMNGKIYKFVLDTGGVLMISKKLQNAYGFEQVKKTTVSDVNSNEIDFTTVRVPEMKIGNWTFKDRPALISKMSGTYPDACFGTDGMIGRDFFQGTILHFDYARKVIRLTEDDSVFDLKSEHRSKLRLSSRGLPDIQLKIDGKKKYIEFDSGSGDFFSFKSKYARKKRKSEKLICNGIFSFGVSRKDLNASTRYKVKVKSFEMGGGYFSDFYSDFSKPTEPRIGASILYYGKVTVDFKNKGFYFEPYQGVTTPSGYETFGFDIGKLGEKYIIKWVLQGSDAEQSGLRYGDQIILMNGQAVEEMARGCEGYINGYAFKKEDQVQLKVIDSKGELRDFVFEKMRFQ